MENKTTNCPHCSNGICSHGKNQNFPCPYTDQSKCPSYYKNIAIITDRNYIKKEWGIEE